MLEIKKINKVDEEYDNYLDSLALDYAFHLKKGACIINEHGVVEINIFSELNLKVASCEYGACTDTGYGNMKMKKLAKLIGEKFGEVYWGEEGGLHIALEITLKDYSTVVYFIAGGNKGQELCVGMYIQNIKQLQDKKLRETISYIDNWLYDAIIKSELDKF